eukprot:1160364-Pelagomonas_calceolata.AAC.7
MHVVIKHCHQAALIGSAGSVLSSGIAIAQHRLGLQAVDRHQASPSGGVYWIGWQCSAIRHCHYTASFGPASHILVTRQRCLGLPIVVRHARCHAQSMESFSPEARPAQLASSGTLSCCRHGLAVANAQAACAASLTHDPPWIATHLCALMPAQLHLRPVWLAYSPPGSFFSPRPEEGDQAFTTPPCVQSPPGVVPASFLTRKLSTYDVPRVFCVQPTKSFTQPHSRQGVEAFTTPPPFVSCVQPTIVFARLDLEKGVERLQHLRVCLVGSPPGLSASLVLEKEVDCVLLLVSYEQPTKSFGRPHSREGGRAFTLPCVSRVQLTRASCRTYQPWACQAEGAAQSRGKETIQGDARKPNPWSEPSVIQQKKVCLRDLFPVAEQAVVNPRLEYSGCLICFTQFQWVNMSGKGGKGFLWEISKLLCPLAACQPPAFVEGTKGCKSQSMQPPVKTADC